MRASSPESGDPHHQPKVMEELKTRAKQAGLWNMFLADAEHGAGLSNSDYAPLAEILGPQPYRLGGMQLLGAGYGQHGGAAPVRHRFAKDRLA